MVGERRPLRHAAGAAALAARAHGAPAADAARALRLPLGARDRGAAGAAPGAGPRVLRAARPRARASAPSTSTRAAGPSSTATATPWPSPWTRRASTRCRRTSTNAAGTAAALGRALGLDAAARRELQAQLQKKRAFVWVRRKVDPAVARAVRDLQLDGIGFLTENRRYYPQRELAAQVLGYVGLDNTGMSGIEYAFEERDPRPRGQGGHPHGRPPPGRRPHREALHRRPHRRAHPRRVDPARGGAGAGARGAGDGLHRRRGGGDGPAHGRDPGPGQPADLQPQPLRRLPELALAQPRGGRRLRAGQHLQDLHRRRRPAGEGGRPRRGDRLRPRLHRDRGHPHQRPRRLRPAHLPRRDGEVERRRA